MPKGSAAANPGKIVNNARTALQHAESRPWADRRLTDVMSR